MRKPHKQKAEDLDFQMAFYESILKENPDFADALMALGDIYTKKGLYQKGLEVDRKLVKLKPDHPLVRYNLACSLSLVGDIADSFKTLRQAIELGYNDFAYMRSDPDLFNLRQDERFEDFMKALRRNSPDRDHAR